MQGTKTDVQQLLQFPPSLIFFGFTLSNQVPTPVYMELTGNSTILNEIYHNQINILLTSGYYFRYIT
jgi:hypothetical protein